MFTSFTSEFYNFADFISISEFRISAPPGRLTPEVRNSTCFFNRLIIAKWVHKYSVYCEISLKVDVL